MSAEYRPVADLPFSTIDKRLEKYGIKVECYGASTTLTGPFGSLFAMPEGNSTHFERALGVDTQAVIDAIEMEYGIEIVDEDDYRFWGFSSVEEMNASFGRSQLAPERWVVIEGPSRGDAEFTKQWLDSAIKTDEAFQAYFRDHPAVREQLRLVEIVALIEFAPCAMTFIRGWLEREGVFSIDLFESENADLFSAMVAGGFFSKAGDRYQMTVPAGVDLPAIRDALLRLAETEDEQGFLHPEKFVVTMTKIEAENWKNKLERYRLGTALGAARTASQRLTGSARQ
jgi:hypothetical protein